MALSIFPDVGPYYFTIKCCHLFILAIKKQQLQKKKKHLVRKRHLSAVLLGLLLAGETMCERLFPRRWFLKPGKLPKVFSTSKAAGWFPWLPSEGCGHASSDCFLHCNYKGTQGNRDSKEKAGELPLWARPYQGSQETPKDPTAASNSSNCKSYW